MDRIQNIKPLQTGHFYPNMGNAVNDPKLQTCSDSVEITQKNVNETPNSPIVNDKKEPKESTLTVKTDPNRNPTAITIIENDTTTSISPKDEIIAIIKQEFADLPELSIVLQKYIEDTKHPMNIVAYLQNLKTRSLIISQLKSIPSRTMITKEELKEIVDKTANGPSPLLKPPEPEFNMVNGRKKMTILRENLLKKDKALFSISDNPTAEEMKLLKAHEQVLRNEILPALIEKLESAVSKIPSKNGFPQVNARAKTAEGMVEKIGRVKSGNDWKAPVPGYCLADMPDAVGGRITVKGIKDLESVVKALEREFGKDNIHEKDSFYSNPTKKYHAYRVITYTVTINGIPCEVQLTTLNASATSDLNHNTTYKKLHPDLGEDICDYLCALQRRVAADEHLELSAQTQ